MSAALAPPPAVVTPGEAVRILASLLARLPRARPRVAAVDGPSGSGKTTFGTALARAAGGVLLSMDDLYPGWDGLDEACRRLVAGVLAPLRAGGTARVRRWDWEGGAEGRLEALPVAAGGVLVVEGVGAACLRARPLVDLTAWIDAPEDVRRARALQRDGAAYAPHWERWAAHERRYFTADRPWHGAAVRVDGADGRRA